jgi:hypothetical protein
MNRMFLTPFSALIGCVITCPCANAQLSSDLPRIVDQKAAILTTMTEALLAQVSLNRDLNRGSEEIREFGWDLRYSERDWVLRAHGRQADKKSEITIAGYLWDQTSNGWNDGWIINYSGLGGLGEEEIRAYGVANWRVVEGTRREFRDMNFRHTARFGRQTIWGWVLGTEIVVGGVIGGAAAAVVGSVAPPALPIVITAGAVGGAASMVGVSAAVKEILNTDNPLLRLLPLPHRSGNKGSLEESL